MTSWVPIWTRPSKVARIDFPLPPLPTLQYRFPHGYYYNDLTLTCQVLHSLEYIHSKGYTHNDVKAANLLSHPDNPNLLYLVDFGLAVKYMKVPLISIRFAGVNISRERRMHTRRRNQTPGKRMMAL